jgi:hypothetical protein
MLILTSLLHHYGAVRMIMIWIVGMSWCSHDSSLYLCDQDGRRVVRVDGAAKNSEVVPVLELDSISLDTYRVAGLVIFILLIDHTKEGVTKAVGPIELM